MDKYYQFLMKIDSVIIFYSFVGIMLSTAVDGIRRFIKKRRNARKDKESK